MTATTDLLAAVDRADGTGVCKGYSYAGLQGSRTVAGVRATVRVVKAPEVREGHVGGWIGVGGPRLGPGGSDQWLQAGYAGFPDGTLQMYWEIALPRQAPAYHVLGQRAVRGETHTISILEVSGKRGSWRVWLDGKAASPVYYLRGSHARYVPQGIGENWSPSTACNSFDWLFADVRVLLDPGKRWIARGKPAYKWQDVGYQVRVMSPDAFETLSRVGS